MVEKAQSTAPLKGGYIGEPNGEGKTESTAHEAPYYFIYGGFYPGRFVQFGTSTAYYSNTAYSATKFYALLFNGGGAVNPYYSNGNRDTGFSIRCVARE